MSGAPFVSGNIPLTIAKDLLKDNGRQRFSPIKDGMYGHFCQQRKGPKCHSLLASLSLARHKSFHWDTFSRG